MVMQINHCSLLESSAVFHWRLRLVVYPHFEPRIANRTQQRQNARPFDARLLLFCPNVQVRSPMCASGKARIDISAV